MMCQGVREIIDYNIYVNGPLYTYPSGAVLGDKFPFR